MNYLYSDNILIVDLRTGELTEEPLPEGFIATHIGGARANLALYEEYKDDDPLIFGTGIFTATPVPASCLGVITGKSPVTGKVGHSPLNLYGGMELKLSGFDFIVLKGKSPKPVYLWTHDGLADLLDAEELWNLDCWQLTDRLRDHIGEDMVQVLSIGEAGISQSPAAGININYWSSADRFGFGALMGGKNLKALAMRGLGMLDAFDPQNFNDKCLELHQRIKAGGNHPGSGFAKLLPLLGGEDIGEWLSGKVHRHSACYACPMSCNTFIKYNEPPDEMRSTEVKEPGMLITGPSYLLKLKEAGFTAAEAGRALELVSRLGLNPDAAADLLLAENASTLAEAEPLLRDLDRFSDASLSGWTLPGAGAVKGRQTFSPWPPFKALSDGIEGEWDEINAIAYIFGICPVFMLTMPEINAKTLAELLEPGAELQISHETVLQKARELLT